MKIVHEVGALKAKSGGAIYRPEREKSIIDRLEKINNENARFFKNIVDKFIWKITLHYFCNCLI